MNRVLGTLWAAAKRWFGPEHEGRSLARDSRWVVNEMERSYGAETREHIASLTRTALSDCRAAMDGRPDRHAQMVGELQRQHREARRRRETSQWTALTLAIIYLKAQAIDEHGNAARANVDEFLGQWQHSEES